MTANQDTGKEGEALAADYLKKLGYRILETNWRLGRLELDIVAIDKNILVIVEVKTRQSASIQSPEMAVDKQKQRMMILAANAFIRQRNITLETRFDIIGIVKNEKQYVLDHLPDAFYPTLR